MGAELGWKQLHRPNGSSEPYTSFHIINSKIVDCTSIDDSFLTSPVLPYGRIENHLGAALGRSIFFRALWP